MTLVDFLITFENGVEQTMQLSTPLIIGRDSQSGLKISSWRVAKQHARLYMSGAVLELEDLGSLRGTMVNGRRVSIYRPVQCDDVIIVGPCRIQIRGIKDVVKPIEVSGLLSRQSGAQLREPSQLYGDSNSQNCFLDVGQANDLSDVQTQSSLVMALSEGDSNSIDVVDIDSFRQRLHRELQQALDLRRRDISGMSETMLRQEAMALLEEISSHEISLPSTVDRLSLCVQVVDEAIGLGPLEPLLVDPSISEIMVNRYDQIYIERDGRLIRHASTFSGEEAVRRVIERIVSKVGRRIDESSPMVDARLSDGSRINAVLPPVALKGANLTIRKFPINRPSMADLIQQGTLSAAMASFLLQCVRSRKNIVVSGGTGAGKTTLLNVLSNGIPLGERIVTIEDSAELCLAHEHCIALEARPDNLEGRGRIVIRDLVKNSLRMRPDRIVVGECRGAEAFDMLTAMNTGHEGSLTTLHANSPRDALSRLEAMVLMAGIDLPLSIVREHIGASIDIVIQQVRLAQGRRVVQSVTEITGLESGRLQVQELFRFTEREGFQGCGVVPSFIDQWVAEGIHIDRHAFMQTEHGMLHRGHYVTSK